MASSPTSNLLLMMRQFLQASRSSPSPFWLFQGLITITSSMMTFWHMKGCRFQAGEFWKQTPCNQTFSHCAKSSSAGRRKSRAVCQSSSVWHHVGTFMSHLRSSSRMACVGAQTSEPCATPVTPPCLSSAFHCPSVSLLRLIQRQASPCPSMVPKPVMAMFFLPTAFSGLMQRRVFSPSK